MKNLLLFALLLFTIRTSAQDENLSNAAVFDGEPYLAIDPANAHHIVVAWIGYTFGQPVGIKTKATFNAGVSWSAVHILPHSVSTYHSADPSLAFDGAGNVFACYIDFRQSPDSGGVHVVKSTDGGLTWNTGSVVVDSYADGNKKPIDRPWLTIDQVSHHQYVTTKPPSWVLPPNRPYYIRSLDDGQTWQPRRYLDTANYLVGNFIAQPMAVTTVSANGELHALYPSWVVGQNPLPGFIHARSTDGGATFTRNGAAYSTTGVNDTLAKGGYHLLADPSDGAHLAFCFLNSTFGDLDVFVIESHDSGSTWGAPIRVNDDPQGNGVMQDLVWGSFDTDGDLAVTWRDRRDGTGTGYASESEIRGTVHWHDSLSFQPDFRISDTIAPYNALYLNASGNDFMSNELRNDTLNTVWGDVRSGHLDIWFKRIAMSSGNSMGMQLINSEPVPQVTLFPNPAYDELRIEGDRVTSVRVFDEDGQLLLTEIPRNGSIPLNGIGPGVLMIELDTAHGVVWRRIEKE